MEFDSDFHSLLHNLKIDGPWTPPKSWESIAVESGDASSINVVPGPQDTLYDLSSVSEAVLVRLVINALQGVRSAIVEIDKLSCSFYSSQADRSFHRVPSLWRWSSSTHALGRMLKSISHSGLLFFFLRDFVSYFFNTEHKYNSAKRDKNEKYLIPSNCGQDKSDTKELPPYSLVNQAFAVAIGKLLEGYISSLNTLPTSIKLRRSEQCKGDSIPTNNREVTLTSAIYSEMTVMEVYLHTKELRSQIDALGSICFSRSFYQTLLSDGLNLNSTIEFHNFPRGADLLSYLYVQFRDVDQVHHALLKYLFVHSYKPYSGFIKLWMYRATIDDPYGEFFVASSDTTPTFDSGSCSLDNFFLASIKSGVSIPCFLKDACHPLLLAGQQLQVLVRLLDFCDLSFSGDYVPCDMSLLREILPFWVDSPIKLDFLSNSLIFDSNGIDALNQKREIMYRTMLDKLQNCLVKFSATDQLTLQNVIAYGSMPILLGEGSGMKIPSMFEYESNFIHGNIDEDSVNSDSNASNSSTEPAFESELSLSAECSMLNYSDESIDKSLYDIHDNLCQPSKFIFSNLPSTDHSKECLLPTNTKNEWQYFHPASFHSSVEHVYPDTCSHHHDQSRKMNQISFSSKFAAIKDSKTSKSLTEICESGGCWPLGLLQSNPFCAYMKCRGPKQLQLIESCFKNDDGISDKLSSERLFSEAFSPFILNFDETGRMQALSRTFTSQLCHSSTVSLHYAFSMDHMLVKAPRIPTVCNSRDVINDNASHFPKLNSSSVTDPFNLHSESVPLGSSYRSKTAASMTVNLGGSVARLEDSGGLFKETEEEQPISASLCYSAGETNSQNYYQLPNAFGGAGWTRSLTYPIKNATYSVGDIHLEGKFLVPLDIILDRCILQEILLQYKYISCFTIKFLEEGFNLREHLLALRRYHFLEISDWADLFVMSLSCQSALQHKPARIQELLDLALQRSSCDNDPYKKRLFICTKEQTTAQLAFANDIHAFDHMVLGYRVDWPVNIIVTQGALKIYADIFRYLLQIRVAVTSQTEVWHYLKGLLCFLKHDQHKTFHEMEDLNILMRMRQHINHFASTLQQYVQSQLSNVTWHRFQDSLKHMVNYMLDLESMHKLYLADALRICFLSDDSKEVAIIVKNILQCALDFRWCFSDHLYEKDKSCLRSQINFAQVSILSNIFEKNLKDLYLLYLKWPTHNEFGLSHLWINLNYNGYFTTIINKDLGYSHL